MNQQTMKRTVVIAIAGAVALGTVSTASAAPVPSSTRAVSDAAPSSVIDVRYYRGYRGRYHRYYGPGIALGALAVVAGAAAYGNGYYGNRGYYGRGYYGGGPYYYGGGPYYGGSPYYYRY
jgi:hypothetical protein